MPFFVKDLIDEQRKPITARSEDSLQVALTRMTEHEYSQLPIVDGENRYLGMVTSDSILRALKTFDIAPKNLLVRDAKTTVRAFGEDHELFELLDELRDSYAVPIVDENKHVIGVVTGYDATEYFRRRTEDVMLVEDIELTLRDYIQAAHTNVSGEIDHDALLQSIKQCARGVSTQQKSFFTALGHYLERQVESDGGQKANLDGALAKAVFAQTFETDAPDSLEQLTFADYIELLLSKDQWAHYAEIFHPRTTNEMRTLLDAVRKTRNALAHFRADITPEQHERLQFCRDWLREHPAVRLTATDGKAGRDWSGPASPVNRGTAEVPIPVASGEERELSDEVIGPRDSRYAPLAVFLMGQMRDRDRVTLTFAEIEDILRDALPPYARQHRAFWSNDTVSHPQSRQWLDVDWRVASVDMSNEVVVFSRIKERQKLYIDFFSALLASWRTQASLPLRNVSPDGQNWIIIAGIPVQGPQVASFAFSFAHNDRLRVELYIDTGDKDRNKRIFDYLYSRREEIEGKCLPNGGDSLSNGLDISMGWERLDERRASRVALYCRASIIDDKEYLNSVISWAAGTGPHFETLMNQLVTDAIREGQMNGLGNGRAQ